MRCPRITSESTARAARVAAVCWAVSGAAETARNPMSDAISRRTSDPPKNVAAADRDRLFGSPLYAAGSGFVIWRRAGPGGLRGKIRGSKQRPRDDTQRSHAESGVEPQPDLVRRLVIVALE